GYFWAATHQQIYRTLKSMEDDGWVRVTPVVQQGRPDKKVYTVSDAGLAEMARWIAEPLSGRGSSVADNRTRDIAIKVRGAAYGDIDAVHAQVAALRAERAELLDTYRGFEKRPFPDPSALAGSALRHTSCCAAAFARRKAQSTGSTKWRPPWRRLDDLSEPVVAVGSRLHHAAQPCGDGFDAHRPRGPGPRHRPAGRVLRRARPRRRRADHHRRLRPQPHRLAAAVRRPDALVVGRPSAPADHRTGARRGRQDPAADPARGSLCVPPLFGERIVDQGADQPVPSAGIARCQRDHRRLRPLC